MKFNVKLPEIAGPSASTGIVDMTSRSPNCAPAGVSTVLVVPLNVMVVDPPVPGNTIEFVPDPLNVPVVENRKRFRRSSIQPR